MEFTHVESCALLVLGSHLYVSAHDTVGDMRWRMEKRALADLSLDTTFGSAGAVTVDPTAAGDEDAPYGIAHAGGVLFWAGRDCSPAAGVQWRIEARFR
jgi:hypothetical protein